MRPAMTAYSRVSMPLSSLRKFLIIFFRLLLSLPKRGFKIRPGPPHMFQAVRLHTKSRQHLQETLWNANRIVGRSFWCEFPWSNERAVPPRLCRTGQLAIALFGGARPKDGKYWSYRRIVSAIVNPQLFPFTLGFFYGLRGCAPASSCDKTRFISGA